MAGTIILDFMDDPLSGVTLIEQLSHQEWVDADLQHRHVSFGSVAHPRRLVATLAHELLTGSASNVIFNLPSSAPLAAQIAVAGTALLEELPQCVHLLYPGNAVERDTASPYRLVGMLPLEAAQRIGQQARAFAGEKGVGKVVVNLSKDSVLMTGNTMTELRLPLHEHNSVASQMSGHVSKLSLKEWRSALVVLPRSSSLAVLALSFLQGLTGRWPSIIVDENSGGDGIVMLENLYKQTRAAHGNTATNNLPLSAYQLAGNTSM